MIRRSVATTLLVSLFVVPLLAGCEGKGEAVVEIAAPPAKVYTWLHEPAKLTRWIGGLKSSVAIEGDSDNPQVGARSKEVIEMPEGTYELYTELTVVEPGKTLAGRITNEGFEQDFRYELTEAAGKTQLRYTMAARFHHWFATLMTPVVMSEAKKKVNDDLERLKDLVEAEAK